MKRVTGIGGIFFKCDDPEKIKEWYSNHLGINCDAYGTSFEWRHSDQPETKGYTAWSPFNKYSTYMEPSKKEFMINYRVENLEALVQALRNEGVTICDEIKSFEYGKFVHILDPENNKIELWEPVDESYEKILNVVTK
ncbi:MAG: VOC family protein [Bacteroidetes bacterium]|nr:VOC family protein [Bacteroidota bacterium]